MKNFASTLRSRLGKSSRHSTHVARRPRGWRPLVELLEARLVLSTTFIAEGPAPETSTYALNGTVLAGNNPTDGMVAAVLADPTNANILYAGTGNGGIWKTTNATNASPTWVPLTDNMPSLSIGALAMQPGNTNVIYAGVADLSSFGNRGGPRIGLYKTADAGATWTNVGQDTFAGQDVRSIATSTPMGGNLLLATGSGVNPSNGYGTGGGVFRSTNGGATWEKRSGLGGLPDIAPSQIINDPGDPTGMRFYAAVPGQGVYLSTDGGSNWAAVNTGLTGASASTRILLSVSNTVDASNKPVNVVDAAILTDTGYSGIFRSIDMGKNWSAIGTSPLTGGVGTETHGAIVADPSNPNIVYITGDFLDHDTSPIYQGDASTGTWTLVAGAAANNTSPHADSRYLTFDAAGNLLEASDGGIARLVNRTSATARTWQPVNGNLQTEEFTGIAYDSLNHVIFGGAQDNTILAQSAKGSLTWNASGYGDGGPSAVDNDQVAHPSTTIRYTEGQFFGGFTRTTFDQNNQQVGDPVAVGLKLANGPNAGKILNQSTGADFYEPYAINAVKPNQVLIADTRIYESTNQGDTLKDLGIVLPYDTAALAYGAALSVT